MKVRWLLLAGIACVLFGAVSVPVQAADVDLPTYVQRLTTARDALTQAEMQAGTQREASIQRATDALNGMDTVTVGSATYPAQVSGALGTLRRQPVDTQRAQAEVTVLLDTVRAVQRTTPDAQARQKLDTILQDRAYHPAEPNPAQEQFSRFRGWVGEQLRRLFSPLDRINPPTLPSPRTTPGINRLATALAFFASPHFLIGLATIAALVVLLLTLWRRRWRRTRRVTETAEPQRSAREWRDHADMLAARGEYRAAVRARYFGTLREMDERGLLAFDAARTDREYVRAATDSQIWLAEPLRPFVRMVEAIFYADAPCGAPEYRAACDHAAAVSQTIAAAMLPLQPVAA